MFCFVRVYNLPKLLTFQFSMESFVDSKLSWHPNFNVQPNAHCEQIAEMFSDLKKKKIPHTGDTNSLDRCG